ncbi:MFS transporter [Spirosoma utsteinense]|uniref:ACS family hexuronate transporter-like MFS transporter n=1 Tax=Spirosoma utsteinense TaxID=2585773 RepID=A0ABR6W296_9BACT|nr:MFS transporter [Spirosoma utsteinense]MBC3786004.1 ACS family hexuronate transporter-like MFS transporter [Spirosoma utsteinense]MBC3790702.1 ACS family hexuronate transporter-like MFS transporter [Spirosoma utsteinense]
MVNSTTSGRFRWRIVALLFIATTINYVDRQVLSFTMTDEVFRKEMLDLAPDATLTKEATDRFKVLYGDVDAAFKFAYAIGFLLAGWLIDKIGTKKGFSIGIVVWSLAGMLTAFVGNIAGLRWARALLGLGEAANFPSSIKTVSEWFPRRERSFANGLFNAGANVGIILTALAVPYLIIQFGWRSSFLVTGVLGFGLLLLWWFTYSKPEQNPKLSPDELAYIRSDDETIVPVKVSWGRLLGYKQTWAFAVGKFMADPIWWFYMSWLPDFFNSNDALDQKLDLKSFGVPFLIIYVVSDAGSIFFGWLTTQFMNLGWTANRARKTTMLICALCVVPIFFAAQTSSLTVAIALIAIATAAHQGWSANMYTFASDLFPKNVVASVTGIGGMFGAVGGILLALLAGRIITAFGYLPMFIIASCAYLIALVIIHLILPNMEPIKTEELIKEPVA